MQPKLLDCLTSIRCFSDESHIVLTLDESGDPLAKNGMIIHHQDTNHAACDVHQSRSSSQRLSAKLFLRVRCGAGHRDLNFGTGVNVAPDFQISSHQLGAFAHTVQTVVAPVFTLTCKVPGYAFSIIPNSHS